MLIPSTNGPMIEIDDCDYWVMKHKWHIAAGGYAMSRYKSEVIYLHLLIAKVMCLTGLIDHIDRNKLNCKRENLRSATIAQNVSNQKLHSNNTTGYKGVSFDSKRQKWRACIMLNRRTNHIGYFYDEITAAKAYDLEARKLHGVFASLNFPETKDEPPKTTL